MERKPRLSDSKALPSGRQLGGCRSRLGPPSDLTPELVYFPWHPAAWVLAPCSFWNSDDRKHFSHVVSH